MTDTVHLGLPTIEGAQAQKHVTHNDALGILDALVMLSAIDRDAAAPPGSPEEGDRYLVKAPGTGGFAGKDNQVAHYIGGGWSFHAPAKGWVCYVEDEATLVVWNGGSWQAAGGGGGGGPITELQNLALLGVGTSADAVNPFAARLNNALWVAKTVAEGGDGHLRYKLSKESAAKTLSLLFQDNYSGRAEIGLVGDDDFHFKVSPDGGGWVEAIRIDRTSGRVSFPASGGPREMLAANRTYYVRTDGSDANDGLANSAGGAFLTLQKAYDVVAAKLDLGGFTVTVQVAPGTYAGGLNVAQPWTGGGAVTFQGDTATPGNVVIATNGSGAHCVNVSAALPGALTVTGFKLTTAGAGSDCVNHVGTGSLVLGTNDYGAATRFHVTVGSAAAIVRMQSAYAISGGAAVHWVANAGGYLTFAAAVTLTGTPAFAAEFALATRVALIELAGGSFTGAATGKRYDVNLNGVILSSGLTLPGNVAGTTATGGQYS